MGVRSPRIVTPGVQSAPVVDRLGVAGTWKEVLKRGWSTVWTWRYSILISNHTLKDIWR